MLDEEILDKFSEAVEERMQGLLEEPDYESILQATIKAGAEIAPKTDTQRRKAWFKDNQEVLDPLVAGRDRASNVWNRKLSESNWVALSSVRSALKWAKNKARKL